MATSEHLGKAQHWETCCMHYAPILPSDTKYLCKIALMKGPTQSYTRLKTVTVVKLWVYSNAEPKLTTTLLYMN